MSKEPFNPANNPAGPHDGPGPLIPCDVPVEEELQSEPLPKKDSTDD